jgi:hypothetical protein
VAAAVRGRIVIRGSSFLFIRIAVEHMPPSVVVFGRTVLGAAFSRAAGGQAPAFRGVRRVIMPIIAVTLPESCQGRSHGSASRSQAGALSRVAAWIGISPSPGPGNRSIRAGQQRGTVSRLGVTGNLRH